MSAPKFTQDDKDAINVVRVFAADATFKSQSGHPGAPMGLAPAAHVLFNYFMKFNSKNPEWFNRDRFVLSNGHACMLQYTMLHLLGYDYSIADLENFRKFGSKCPGHPEAELPGIEVTTGPLGQGISNAVGIAIAEAHLASTFNKDDIKIVDNFTFCILGDGCLMEGVASEAMSLAGHQQLGHLIALWDDNHISIDGDTNVAFTEDVVKRVEAYGWHVQAVEHADDDLEGIFKAIEEAKKVTDKPSFIKLRTTIGFGSKNQGTHGVHGSPLKEDDIKQLKEKFGFDPSKSFNVPENVAKFYEAKRSEGAEAEKKWNDLLEQYKQKYPKEAQEFVRRINRELPEGWEKALPTYKPTDKAVASRKLSETVLTAIESTLPELFGGSADLTGSNLTRWPNAVDFQPEDTKLGTPAGRYFRYGVREHGMGAIMNGIASYHGVVPYGGTFLNFVSYAAGAVRLSALSGHRVIWVATHDSIGLGEDGPTHQPIETLTHFRALPNTMVWRPADGNEVSAAYKVAIESRDTPTIMALSRQNLPQLEGSSIEKASKGGYAVYESEGTGKVPDLILASTGSEVFIAIDGAKELEKDGHKVRVVSLPDFHTFDQQPEEYRLGLFPDGAPVMSVEVMSKLSWMKYAHEYHNIDHFGASGPQPDLYKAFDFTAEGVAKRGELVIKKYKGQDVHSRLHKAAFKNLEQLHGGGPFHGHNDVVPL